MLVIQSVCLLSVNYSVEGASLTHNKFNRQLPLVLGIAKSQPVQKYIPHCLEQISNSFD